MLIHFILTPEEKGEKNPIFNGPSLPLDSKNGRYRTTETDFFFFLESSLPQNRQLRPVPTGSPSTGHGYAATDVWRKNENRVHDRSSTRLEAGLSSWNGKNVAFLPRIRYGSLPHFLRVPDPMPGFPHTHPPGLSSPQASSLWFIFIATWHTGG